MVVDVCTGETPNGIYYPAAQNQTVPQLIPELLVKLRAITFDSNPSAFTNQHDIDPEIRPGGRRRKLSSKLCPLKIMLTELPLDLGCDWAL